MTQEEQADSRAVAKASPKAVQKFEDLDYSNEQIAIGRIMAASGMFAERGITDTRQGIAQAIMTVQAGHELGFMPMESMQGIFWVKGRLFISGDLIASSIKRHPKYDYRVTEETATKCTIQFIQIGANGNPVIIGETSYTIEQAKRMGDFSKKTTYKEHPEDMLFARAMTKGARRHCPDAFKSAVHFEEADVVREVEVNVGLPEVTEATAWARFWAIVNDLGYKKADVHAAFGVDEDAGALKLLFADTATKANTTMIHVISEMADTLEPRLNGWRNNKANAQYETGDKKNVVEVESVEVEVLPDPDPDPEGPDTPFEPETGEAPVAQPQMIPPAPAKAEHP